MRLSSCFQKGRMYYYYFFSLSCIRAEQRAGHLAVFVMRDWGSRSWPSWYSLYVWVVVVTALTLFRMMLEKPEGLSWVVTEDLWKAWSLLRGHISQSSVCELGWLCQLCHANSLVFTKHWSVRWCCRKMLVWVQKAGGVLFCEDGWRMSMDAWLVHTPSSVWEQMFLHRDSSTQKWKAGMQRPWSKVSESQQGSSFLQGHELCFFLEDLTHHRLMEEVQKELDVRGRKGLCADEGSDAAVENQ